MEILNLAKDVFKGRRWFEHFSTKELTDAENNGNIVITYPRISLQNMVVVMGRGVTPPVPQPLANVSRTSTHDFFHHSPC